MDYNSSVKNLSNLGALFFLSNLHLNGKNDLKFQFRTYKLNQHFFSVIYWINPNFFFFLIKCWLFFVLRPKFVILLSRVDLHKAKMLILQFHTSKTLIIQVHTSNVRKNANHTIFIQFQKNIEKNFQLVSTAIWTRQNSLVMKKTMFFCAKNWLSYNFQIQKMYD